MNAARIGLIGLALLASVAGRALPAAADDTSPGACAVLDDDAVLSVLDSVHGEKFDPTAAGAIMEDNVVVTTPLGGVLTGREAVVSAYEELTSSFSGLSLREQDVLVDEPYVVVRFDLTGRQTGDFGDVPTTGKDVATSGITVYRMHCGKIAEAWTQLNLLGLLAQIDEDYAAFMPVDPEPVTVAADSCPAPTAADLQTLVRQVYTEAWTRTPDFAAVFDPDIVVHSALGRDFVGIQAVAEMNRDYFEATPNLTYRHGEIMTDGDLAATLWTATGTDTGSGFLGLEPSGKTMILDGISIFRGRCGKIAEMWRESDLAGARRQLGAK